MRAALVTETGTDPVVGDFDPGGPPEGEVAVRLEAASLNPVDLAVAGGTFYGGHPPLPYVPCVEGVGKVDDRRFFVLGGGLGVARNGTASEVFLTPEEALVELPPGADVPMAAALGTAALAGWLPITWRAKVQPGETVIVLGATGTAGTIALQAARYMGADHIVAVGRNPSKLEALAAMSDATVPLETGDFAAALQAAAPDGADVIYDILWGEPLAASLTTAKPGARVVHVGQSADTMATVASNLVRGRQLTVMGYSNFAVPREDLVEAYLRMVSMARDGDLTLEVETVALDDIAVAWAGAAASAGKYVIVP